MPKIFFQLDPSDANYVSTLRAVSPCPSQFNTRDLATLLNLVTTAKGHGCDGIATADLRVLSLLVPDCPKPSIDNFAGSLFKAHGMDILIIPPPKQLISVSYGAYVTKKLLTKISHPQLWFKETEFNYTVLENDDLAEAQEELETADFIVIDIETPLHTSKLIIGDYGVTGIWWDEETHRYVTRSYVVDVNSMAKVYFMRNVNALNIPKVGQNFKYDLSFMMLWGAPVTAWYWDTITLAHCWLAELPKDLAFITTLHVRNAFNWKYKGKSSDRNERIRYNAMDTWATANAFLSMIKFMPDWAMENYYKEFPVNFPCVLTEVQGIAINVANFKKAKLERTLVAERLLHNIRTMVGIPTFNPSSPDQTKKLLAVLGFRDIASADEKVLSKCRLKSALAARIIKAIIQYRGVKKELTTYLIDSANYLGRCKFTSNPHGTDTGRQAVRKHQFSFGSSESKRTNIGLQLQTIPRGDDDAVFNFEFGVKHIFEADVANTHDGVVRPEDEFLIGEADYAQAEARDVAYLSGDENLIAAVDSSRDFHSVNASAFFGIPYEEIYQDAIDSYIDGVSGEVIEAVEAHALNKNLRNLAKRVNHGANYNMGANVLIETMGEDKVLEAQKLLKLPPWWKLRDVAQFLLDRYEATYPDVKGTWYKQLKLEIKTTKLLVGGTGWTRLCFGNPDKDKRALNSYVAHKPQNLNAMTLNIAVMKVFKYALQHPKTFRFSLQIHDSILFQYLRGHEYHADAVVDMMTFPLPIKDARGKVRQLTVPADCKHGARIWGDIKG